MTLQKRMAKLNCKINPIETFQYPTPCERPLLNKSTFNIEIPYWKDSLEECLWEKENRCKIRIYY